MIHKIKCHACNQLISLDRPGDLGQFYNDDFPCPNCAKNSLLIQESDDRAWSLIPLGEFTLMMKTIEEVMDECDEFATFKLTQDNNHGCYASIIAQEPKICINEWGCDILQAFSRMVHKLSL